MVDVVGVPGIRRQRVGHNHMPAAQLAALSGAIQRACGSNWPRPSLDLAHYGDLFLAPAGSEGPAHVLGNLDGHPCPRGTRAGRGCRLGITPLDIDQSRWPFSISASGREEGRWTGTR